MRLPQRLTIRLKILTVTAILLLIFALANVFSIKFTRGVIHELNTITDYFTSLSALTSKIDVEAFEFELSLRRLLQENARQHILPRMSRVSVRWGSAWSSNSTR